MKREKINTDYTQIRYNCLCPLDNREQIDDTNLNGIEYISEYNGEIFNFGDEENDDIVLAKFKFSIVYGDDNTIYETLDNQSEYTSQFGEEIYDYDEVCDYMFVKEEYDDLLMFNKFIILDEVKIKEQYRGQGLIKNFINTLNRMYGLPIILKPFPLQYQPTNDNDEYIKSLPPIKGAMKKVVDSYKKCGFRKVKRNSEFMILV